MGARSSQPGRAKQSRLAKIESLETRQLLASDLGVQINDTDVLLAGPAASYSGVQDGQGTLPTDAFVDTLGQSISLSGNAWKSLPIDFIVTPETVLTFDFTAGDVGEIIGIGLDENSSHNDTKRIIQIAGSTVLSSFYQQHNDVYAGGTQHYEIPIGELYTGSMSKLVFVADDDADASANATFANVAFSHPTNLAFQTNGIASSLAGPAASYSGVQDSQGNLPGYAFIGELGQSLTLQGNAWKSMPIDYTVTPTTVLSFDFSAMDEGEIIGIGLDENSSHSDTKRIFQLAGSTSLSSFHQVQNSTYSGGVQRYEIPIGEHYTGPMSRLVFVADDDADGSSDVTFENISVRDSVSLNIQVNGVDTPLVGKPEPYSEGQDGQNGLTADALVSQDSHSLTIQGNAWKQLPIEYTVTPQSVLSFDLTGNDVGEVIVIGLDENNSRSDALRGFQLAGSDTATQFFQSQNGLYVGGTQHYEIPIGQLYTGPMSKLFFIADDDADGSSDVTFANLSLTHPADLILEMNDVNTALVGEPVPYGNAQDGGGGLPAGASVDQDGQSVTIHGNAWKSLPVDYRILPQTVLSFDLSASDVGEIVGIGLDENSNHNDTKRIIQLAGSTPLSSFYQQHNGLYVGGTRHYEIPIGEFYTGPMSKLAFVADDDADGSSFVTFSNLSLFNPFLAPGGSDDDSVWLREVYGAGDPVELTVGSSFSPGFTVEWTQLFGPEISLEGINSETASLVIPSLVDDSGFMFVARVFDETEVVATRSFSFESRAVENQSETIRQIFADVHDNVELEFYTGLKKGPQATSETLSGNPWDQAALLAENLNDAGFNASIVSGEIEVPISEVMRWVGARQSQAAIGVIQSAFDESPTLRDSNADGTADLISFQHAWVRIDPSPETGIQPIDLDPSWKFKDRQAGIDILLESDRGTFDEFAFLADPDDQLPVEFYEDEVMDFLAARGLGESLANVAYDGPIIPAVFSGEPLVSDPHLTIATGVIVEGEFSDIVAGDALAHTHRVELSIGSWSHQIVVPESSQGSFIVRRDLDGYVFLVDGIPAHSASLPTLSNEKLVLRHAKPQQSYSEVEPLEFDLAPGIDGRFYTISLDANQFSTLSLDRLRAEINEAASDGADVDDIDEVLNYINARYWYDFNRHGRQANDLMHVINVNANVNSGLVTADRALVDGDFSYLQTPIIPRDTGVDFPNANQNPIRIDASTPSDLLNREAFQLGGYNASALEHAVLEEVVHNESISTIRGLKDAYTGDPIIYGDAPNSVWVVESTPTDNGRQVYVRGEIGERALEGEVLSQPYEADRTNFPVYSKQQFLDNFPGHRSGTPPQTYSIGDVSGGIAFPPLGFGDFIISAFFMHSQQNVYSRFGGQVTAGKSSNVLLVRHVFSTPFGPGGKWQFANHLGWVDFTPQSTDRLLASFSSIAGVQPATPLEGRTGSLQGIQLGYSSGDLAFPVSYSWGSTILSMAVTGTYFGSPIPNNTSTNPNIARLWDQLTDNNLSGTSVALVPQELSYAGNASSNWGGTVYLSAREFSNGSIAHNYTIASLKDGLVTNGGYGSNVVQPKNLNILPAATDRTIFAGDPVNVLNGNMFRDEVDVAMPNTGVPLDFARHYDSQSDYDIGLARGWIHSFGDRLIQEDGNSEKITWLNSEGVRYDFTKEDGLWKSPSSLLGNLIRVTDGFVYKESDGIEHHFKSVTAAAAAEGEHFSARLSKIVDRNGHGVEVVYASSNAGFTIDKVQDINTSSRYLDFSYTDGKISRIVKHIGGQGLGSWHYAYDASGMQLLSAANAENEVTRFDYYESGSLADTISKITEADGSYHAYEYYPNGRTFRVKEGMVVDGSDVEQSSHSFSYNLFRNLTEFTDENGNVETYVHQDDGQLIRHIHDDRSRIVTQWGVEDLSGEIIEGTELLTSSIIDETGALETFEYYLDETGSDAFKNSRLYQASEKHFPGQTPLLTEFDYTQAALGFEHIVNPESITLSDGSGAQRTTTLQYDNRGRLETQTDPFGQVTTFDYFADDHQTSYLRGLRSSQTQAGEGTPATFDTLYSYDSAGLVTSTIADGLPGSSVAYHHTGAPSLVVDATGISTETGYDSLGRAVSVTQLGDVITTSDDLVDLFEYDPRGRLIRSTDALGRVTQFDYDRRGNVVRQTDADGAVARFEYDAVGNRIASIDALGRTTKFLYNSRHQLTQTIFPDGESQFARYDNLGRVTETVDALGRKTQFQYDAAGRLLETRFAVGSDDEATTAYQYNVFGDLTQTVDANGNVTQFVYDSLGRVTKTQVLDPRDNADRDNPTHTPISVVTTDYDVQGNRASTTVYDVPKLADQTTTLLSDDPRSLIISHPQYVQVTAISYDVLNRPVEIVYADGTSSRTEYDAAGRVQYQYDELDRITELQYDDFGRLSQTISHKPIPSIGSFPIFGFNVAATSVTQFGYDAVGNQTSIIDANGNQTEFQYDPLNRVVKTTDAEGGQFRVIYDIAGQVVATIDALGRTSVTSYDDRGRVSRVASPDPDGIGPQQAAQTHFAYDAVGNLVERVDPQGYTTTYTYDDLNRLKQEEFVIGEVSDESSEAIEHRSFTYDDRGNQLSETDTLDRTTNYTYDALGRIETVLLPDPDGAGEPLPRPLTTTFYDGYGNVTSTIEDRGGQVRETAWSYDARNRVLTETIDAGGSQEVVVAHDYDDVGNRISQTSVSTFGDSAATTWKYDFLNRVEQQADFRGGVIIPDDFVGPLSPGSVLYTEFNYDGVNNLIESRGRVLSSVTSHTEFVYDKLNRQTQVTRDPDGSLETTTHYQYDAVGNLRFVTDGLNQVSENRYDRLDLLVESIAPDPDGSSGPLLSATTKFAYDVMGNLVSDTNGENETQNFIYDSLGRLLRSYDALNAETVRSYDSEGNLLTFTDPNGNTTTYNYDDLNRLETETITLPIVGDVVRSTTYSAQGNIAETVDRNGRRRTFVYDKLDRPTIEQWFDGTTLVHQLERAYDGAGRVIRSEDNDLISHRVETFSYDSLGRMTSQRNYDPANLTLTTGVKVEHRYQYDVDTSGSPLLSTVYSQHSTTDGSTFSRIGETKTVSDQLGRTAQIEERTPFVGVNKSIDFVYDDADQLEQLKRSSRNYLDPNGTTGIFEFDTDYDYDQAGRLKTLSHEAFSSSNSFTSYAYQYDQANRITQQTTSHAIRPGALSGADSIQTENFAFDDAGQLSSDEDRTYQYDSNGNRDDNTTTVGVYNRLESDAEYTYEYDNEGNLTQRTNNAGGDYVSFSWDHHNRLQDVEHFLSDNTPIQVIDYAYSADGQLTDRQYKDLIVGSSSSQHDGYVYQGSHLVLDFDQSSEVLQHRYIWGPGVDQLLVDEKWDSNSGPSQRLWAANDHLGSVGELIEIDDNEFAEHREYDSFGNLVAAYDETGSTKDLDALDSVFAFAGRRWDKDADLYYNRARWYEPESARFLGEDPIGFADGPNLYQYAGNDPVNLRDPSGLSARKPTDGVSSSLFRLAGSAVSSASNTFTTGVNYLAGAAQSAVSSFTTFAGDFAQQSINHSRSNLALQQSQLDNLGFFDFSEKRAARANISQIEGRIQSLSRISQRQGRSNDLSSGSSFFAGVSGAFQGLGTGTKALVNSSANAVTLGFSGDVYEPTAFDLSVGYNTARFATGISAEIGVGLLTGGASRYGRVGKAAFAFDATSNVVGAGRATNNIRQNGFSYGNTTELVGSAFGLSGNVAAGSQAFVRALPNPGLSTADSVLGQVDNVGLERLRLGAEIEVPAGTQGIRQMMSDLSVVSGNEAALVRLESGRRVLTLGGPNTVRLPRTTSRVIAHTHPKGSLRLSPQDVRTLNRFKQRSTVLISPREDFGVRVPIPQLSRK